MEECGVPLQPFCTVCSNEIIKCDADQKRGENLSGTMKTVLNMFSLHSVEALIGQLKNI